MKLLGRGSLSVVASSWSYLCCTYVMDHSKIDYFSRRMYKIKYPAPSEDLEIKGSLIRDLVLYHSDNMSIDDSRHLGGVKKLQHATALLCGFLLMRGGD